MSILGALFDFFDGVFIACRCFGLVVVLACMVFCYDYFHAKKRLPIIDEIVLLVAAAFSFWMMFESVMTSMLSLAGAPLVGFIVGILPCVYFFFRICHKLFREIQKMHGRN